MLRANPRRSNERIVSAIEILDELHYYEPPMIVAYRLRISIGLCADFRRAGLNSFNPSPRMLFTHPTAEGRQAFD